jgi:hypothetical protein
MIPKVGEIYSHYKNKKTYRIVGVGKHSETEEDLVFYETLYDNPISKYWARPLEMFIEEVEHEGNKVQRFTKVS